MQACQVGLNFASEEEAKRFRAHVTELLGRRQRKSGTSLTANLPTYLTLLTAKNDERNHVFLVFHSERSSLTDYYN